MSGPRVGVCGLGLIGGSALLALRAAGVDVRGCDVWPDPRTWCEDLGVPADGSPEATARAVDVLLLCVPPHATAKVAAAALSANPDLVVVDTASVKGPVVDEVRARVPGAAGRFLPAHPLAGAERGGFAAARADLLDGATWAVCPPADDPDGVADTTATLLTAAPVLDALGARLVACTPEDHDRALAATSHAPHVVAGTLAELAAGPPAGGPLAAVLSGGALRDMTRVAGAPSGLWVEILHANATPTADALEAAADGLRAAAAALRAGEHDDLQAAWDRGVAAHDAIAAARWTAPSWEPVVVADGWPGLLALGARGVAVRGLADAGDGRLVGERSGAGA
ncbi:prephenate dehydrogenase [Patulibacter minatonensis]|uniref:prephenate dehydrogenase n=1 Tax=Patulibacter minatonensis TaxID=298163 RepID=UPI0006866914|nr:prephenate dehydrogenase/arogenate dehydrogenase family protein [Patulibacter minatonensis]